MPDDRPVLVTGGSGFVAGHCVRQLLHDGRRVRTTIRSADRETRIREQLATEGDGALEFVVADLGDDAGWDEAAEGCKDVLHIASPIPHGSPRDENAVIGPARDGTLRVLRAAHRAEVGRVVLTSAFHAIGFGWGRTDHTFTEADWSRLDGPGIDAYGKSKTLAERAAWEFQRESPAGTELVVLNPVAVLGPLLGRGSAAGVSGANELVRRILTGALPGYPDLWIPIVDVRDVAAAHAAALTEPAAAGRRLLLFSGAGLTLSEIGGLLRSELGEQADRVPTRRIPSWLLRVAARFSPEVRSIAADLGVVKRIDGSAAEQVLGWHPRGPRQTVLDTARSMIDAGLLDRPAGDR